MSSAEKARKITNLLTICIKAGKTVKGFDSVCTAMKENKISCVLAASDTSAKTLKETAFMCEKYNVKLVEIPVTKEEIGKLCGKQTAVTGICDSGFAEKLAQLAGESNTAGN